MEVLALLLICYVTGNLIERAHLKRLIKHEADLGDIAVLNTKSLSPSWQIERTEMVSGSVVISMDYFKKFAAAIRNIFGGNLRSMEPLLDRARREALVRMRTQAKNLGASVVVNVRLEVSRIGLDKRGNGTGCAEMLAYGTAVVVKR